LQERYHIYTASGREGRFLGGVHGVTFGEETCGNKSNKSLNITTFIWMQGSQLWWQQL